jgi:hypothetical protein
MSPVPVPATNDESNDTSSLIVEDHSCQSSTENVISKKLVGASSGLIQEAGTGLSRAATARVCGNDIFVHYTSINVSESQYKYLSREYVEFTLLNPRIRTTSSTNVTGICGDRSCETVGRSFLCVRTRTTTTTPTIRLNPITPNPVFGRGGGGREEEEEGSGRGKLNTRDLFFGNAPTTNPLTGFRGL